LEQQLAFFLALAVGLVFGGLAVWLMLRADTSNAFARAKAQMAGELSAMTERLSGKEARIEDLTKDREQLKAEIEKQKTEISKLQQAKAELEARLADSDKIVEEKLALIEQAREKLTDSFKAASQEALQHNNQAFLDLAKVTLEKHQKEAEANLENRTKVIDDVVKPLQESILKVDASMKELEKARVTESATLAEQIKSLMESQGTLRAETSNLVNAFRVPAVRGRWGEIQLRRVVELAGMVRHCDFDEQASVETEEGRLRPDMVIHLPNDRDVVVDAKVSLKAYLEAVDAADEETRTAKLKEHAAQIRAHLQRLGSKSYWNNFQRTPEFVVAFLPGESFFGAALEQDPGLIEFGIDQKVILATPTTLIALLKSVSYGWRQEKIAENAEQISNLGKVLYSRLRTFTKYMEDIRKNLQRTVEGYNRAVGSLESRVLVGARRFKELGAAAKGEIAIQEPVDNFPRSLGSLAASAAVAELDAAEAEETEQIDSPGELLPPEPPDVAREEPGEADPTAEENEEERETVGASVELLNSTEPLPEEEPAEVTAPTEELAALDEALDTAEPAALTIETSDSKQEAPGVKEPEPEKPEETVADSPFPADSAQKAEEPADQSVKPAEETEPAATTGDSAAGNAEDTPKTPPPVPEESAATINYLSFVKTN